MDEPADFALVEQMRISASTRQTWPFATDDILALLAREPQLATLNTLNINAMRGWRDRWPRRTTHDLTVSAFTDPLSPGRAEHSLRSQTFSQEPPLLLMAPPLLFIERGQGARVWDVDGNEYLDFASGLLAISLGYCDPEVNQAVLEQLNLAPSSPFPIGWKPRWRNS